MEKQNKSGTTSGEQKRSVWETATDVKVPANEMLMTDGPYVDSKEQIDRIALDDGDANPSVAEPPVVGERAIDLWSPRGDDLEG